MKRVIETDEKGGLESLLGETVILLCANYFYAGKLTAVNAYFVELTDPVLVYETGNWDNKNYADAQKLPAKTWFVKTSFIESFGRGK